MRCAEARDELMAGSAAAAPAVATPSPALAGHLAGCAACAAFAARLDGYRAAMPGARVAVAPGPDFSARVVAQLPDTVELLGWASLRLMPAALALALLCSWYSFTHGPGISDLLLSADDPALLTTIALGPAEVP